MLLAGEKKRPSFICLIMINANRIWHTNGFQFLTNVKILLYTTKMKENFQKRFLQYQTTWQKTTNQHNFSAHLKSPRESERMWNSKRALFSRKRHPFVYLRDSCSTNWTHHAKRSVPDHKYKPECKLARSQSTRFLCYFLVFWVFNVLHWVHHVHLGHVHRPGQHCHHKILYV